jgi:hypothetical protein
MSSVSAFLAGMWEFIVGDDWRTAFGVVVALGVTAALAHAGVPAWWVMPVAALVLLALSVRRLALHSHRSARGPRRRSSGIDE